MTPLSLLGGSHALTTVASANLTDILDTVSVAVFGAGVILLIVLAAALVMTHKRRPNLKAPLFMAIVLVAVIATLTLSSVAITLSLNSPTAGPVRWGADYQVWACDNQLSLRDSRGPLGNRLGTPAFYSQDGRIHYNGTPLTLPDDASLGKFMQSIGGELSDTSLVVPLNNQTGFAGLPAMPDQVQPYISTGSQGATAGFASGQTCGAAKASVQVFVYSYNTADKTYIQTKLPHPASYELSHSRTSPPGDCVIIEFAPDKDRTDHLCPSYGVRDYDRCTDFGVPADKIASCDIREVPQ